MARYVPIARARAVYYDDVLRDMVATPDTLTVFETDDGPVATGLVDAQGVALYRVREREPIGIQPLLKRRRKR